jgi:hypothetical protein
MRSALITIFALLLLISPGCGDSPGNKPPEVDRSSSSGEASREQATESETPQEAAAVIVELFKKEDYETLILERYSEWERTKNMPESGAPDEALKKVASSFERRRDQMIGLYELLAETEFTVQENERPQPGETEKMAVATITFNGREGEAKLYLMESGRWGFHL